MTLVCVIGFQNIIHKEFTMTEDQFFQLEEELVELMARYKDALEERDLDFDENMATLMERATEE